jgi:hypothetical protein
MRTFPVVAVGLLVPALALGGFSASSHRKASRDGASPWDAAAALDGNPATAWLVDPEQPNAGQWLQLDVPNGKVDKLSVNVGWEESDDAWADHARLKKARVELVSLAGGEAKTVLEKEVEFKDEKGRQTVDLPDTAVGDELEGGRVRLVVLEVYPGKDYENLAVSEVLVHLGEFDAQTRKVVNASTTADGHAADAVVDADPKTFWASRETDAEPTLVVSAGRYSASSITFTDGPATYARPKKIEIVQSDAKRVYDVPEKAGVHTFEVPPLFGYTGSNFGDVTIKILETWPGTTSKSVAIADVKFKATAFEPF